VFDGLGLDPVPFVVAEVLGGESGGTATIVGDPTNIIIGSSRHWSTCPLTSFAVIPRRLGWYFHVELNDSLFDEPWLQMPGATILSDFCRGTSCKWVNVDVSDGKGFTDFCGPKTDSHGVNWVYSDNRLDFQL